MSGKNCYLVTANAEYYVYVNADSPEEAKIHASHAEHWQRTIGLQLTDYQTFMQGPRREGLDRPIEFLPGFEPIECKDCGTIDDVTYAPDPYAQDIHGDETHHYMCGDCRDKRAEET